MGTRKLALYRTEEKKHILAKIESVVAPEFGVAGENRIHKNLGALFLKNRIAWVNREKKNSLLRYKQRSLRLKPKSN